VAVGNLTRGVDVPGTEVGHVRASLVVVTVLAVLPVAGCRDALGDACSVDTGERPARQLAEPEVPLSPGPGSNLGLALTSTLEEPVRVTVEVARQTALDVEVPGSGPECAHQPVYSYAYDVPRRRVRVTASTDRGESASRTVTLGEQKQWLVVQVQAGFPLQLTAQDDRPQFG
jgi:hypothetical protein